jgi:hypothetical protein
MALPAAHREHRRHLDALWPGWARDMCVIGICGAVAVVIVQIPGALSMLLGSMLLGSMLLGGCAYDYHAANADCLRVAGCVSSFPGTGYGPIHAQAVAPDTGNAPRPQR